MLDLLSEASFLCNSDKYSLFLSFMQMPNSYRNMVASQFSSELSAIQETLKADTFDPLQKIRNIANQYIRDLYRFYKLFPYKNDFDDVFEIKPELYQIKHIREIISDIQSLTMIGEYYFNRNYFEDALQIFDSLLKVDAQNETLYQKKGYCLHMTNQIKKALDAYLKAELLQPSHSWTLKKIASCYRELRMPEEALYYYRKVEQINPDNLSIQLSMGHCLLELNQYPEALKCYFKVEYLDKNGHKAWRPIAWCLFLSGKYEQAIQYYDQILTSEKPESTDYLNAGHAYWAVGNLKKAIENYKASVQTQDNSIEQFIHDFFNDIPFLLKQGISESDLAFIPDQVKYVLSNG